MSEDRKEDIEVSPEDQDKKEELASKKEEKNEKSGNSSEFLEEVGESEINKLREENHKLNDRYIRLLAQLENSVKKYESEIIERETFAIGKLVKELLEPIENLYRAIDVFEKYDIKAKVSDDDLLSSVLSLKQGVELTLSEFMKVLNSYGVVRISPKMGDVFDYNIHQALERVDVKGNLEQNAIVEVIQVGYKMKTFLLRPALVRVAA